MHADSRGISNYFSRINGVLQDECSQITVRMISYLADQDEKGEVRNAFRS